MAGRREVVTKIVDGDTFQAALAAVGMASGSRLREPATAANDQAEAPFSRSC